MFRRPVSGRMSSTCSCWCPRPILMRQRMVPPNPGGLLVCGWGLVLVYFTCVRCGVSLWSPCDGPYLYSCRHHCYSLIRLCVCVPVFVANSRLQARYDGEKEAWRKQSQMLQDELAKLKAERQGTLEIFTPHARICFKQIDCDPLYADFLCVSVSHPIPSRRVKWMVSSLFAVSHCDACLDIRRTNRAAAERDQTARHRILASRRTLLHRQSARDRTQPVAGHQHAPAGTGAGSCGGGAASGIRRTGNQTRQSFQVRQ